MSRSTHMNESWHTFKGGPKPLEKESHETFHTLVSNVMIDFPTLFLKWYQKHVKVRFSYLLWPRNLAYPLRNEAV